MELKVFWTDFAKAELKSIFEYYNERVSYTIAKNLTIGIVEETLKLQKQPFIGQIEDLLIHRSEEFRYLVYKNYKIIYHINTLKNQVEINDVFDTRQNPVKIRRSGQK